MNDSISRAAAIKAIMGLPTWWADEGGYYGGAQPPMEALLDPEDAVSAIENLPSAEPEPQWIPCSERLPKKEGWYLISVKTGNVTKAFYRVAPIKQGGCYWRGHITKPTAWMPLPEPWKEET